MPDRVAMGHHRASSTKLGASASTWEGRCAFSAARGHGRSSRTTEGSRSRRRAEQGKARVARLVDGSATETWAPGARRLELRIDRSKGDRFPVVVARSIGHHVEDAWTCIVVPFRMCGARLDPRGFLEPHDPNRCQAAPARLVTLGSSGPGRFSRAVRRENRDERASCGADLRALLSPRTWFRTYESKGGPTICRPCGSGGGGSTAGGDLVRDRGGSPRREAWILDGQGPPGVPSILGFDRIEVPLSRGPSAGSNPLDSSGFAGQVPRSEGSRDVCLRGTSLALPRLPRRAEARGLRGGEDRKTPGRLASSKPTPSVGRRKKKDESAKWFLTSPRTQTPRRCASRTSGTPKPKVLLREGAATHEEEEEEEAKRAKPIQDDEDVGARGHHGAGRLRCTR